MAEAQKIAVIGSGISGLSAAWLLSQAHDVTVFEAEHRLGGHSHTILVPGHGTVTPVDMGFIVYNEPCYPNLTALFAHLGVTTRATEMTFAVSLDNGRLEYTGDNLDGIFLQRRNIFRKRHWVMLRDIMRFYREAPVELTTLSDETLAAYLDRRGYSVSFREDHLYPMAAAVWSMPASTIGGYPARSFIRFCENHGLLKVSNRPQWRTVVGGSRSYVSKISRPFADKTFKGRGVTRVTRQGDGVHLFAGDQSLGRFDQVVLACHADQALAMLPGATAQERRLVGAFKYSENEAYMHSDESLMPQRRKAWSSWNYMADGNRPGSLSVSYWMNSLQHIDETNPIFVTLNPLHQPKPESVMKHETFMHPIFDSAAMAAQEDLWDLQGEGGVWFAGSYFGSGFHEDGLQAGLAVAEAIGGVRRPWNVADESGRIFLKPKRHLPVLMAAE